MQCVGVNVSSPVYKLERFCHLSVLHQLCHWICFVRCRRFCIRVCPPIFNHPWFTHVGDFDILSDFNPATGLTNTSHGHGGPDYGFFGGLSLRGFCRSTSPRSRVRRWRTGSSWFRGRHHQHHRWLRL